MTYLYNDRSMTKCKAYEKIKKNRLSQAKSAIFWFSYVFVVAVERVIVISSGAAATT